MRPAPASRTTEMRSPMHQQPYKIVLVPLVPGVVLVLCQRCQQVVVACPDAEDALWAAACHAARGEG
jgi:hypothetical protein